MRGREGVEDWWGAWEALTTFSVALILHIFLPVQSILRVLLDQLRDVTLRSSVGLLAECVACSIIFPSSHRPLHSLIVEIGVVLLLERSKQTFQLLQPVSIQLQLSSCRFQMIPQFIHSRTRQFHQLTQFPAFPRPSLHSLASFTPLHILQLLLHIPHFNLRSSNLRSQTLQSILHGLS